jgi:hypothetical protein
VICGKQEYALGDLQLEQSNVVVGRVRELMPAKTYAVVLGVVLILLGVAGLLLGDELLLGPVNIDVVEDMVHVVSGGLLLFAGLQRNASVTRGVVGVVSVVYLLVGALGFVLPYLLGLLRHGYSVVDNLIHLVLDILSLLIYANSQLPEAEEVFCSG